MVHATSGGGGWLRSTSKGSLPFGTCDILNPIKEAAAGARSIIRRWLTFACFNLAVATGMGARRSEGWRSSRSRSGWTAVPEAAAGGEGVDDSMLLLLGLEAEAGGRMDGQEKLVLALRPRKWMAAES